MFYLLKNENSTSNAGETQFLPIDNTVEWVEDAVYNSSAVLTGAQSKDTPAADGVTTKLPGLTWKNYAGTKSYTCKAVNVAEGTMMIISSGKLVPATGTSKPTYITAADVPYGSKEAAVLRITPDMMFEVETSADASAVAVGAVVTIDGTGTKVTATTSSGVATIVENNAKASGDKIKVRIL